LAWRKYRFFPEENLREISGQAALIDYLFDITV
jgi:hypothetical protein